MVKLKHSLYRVTRETSIKRAKRQESIEPKHPAAYYYDDANFTQQTNIGLMSKICQDCQAIRFPEEPAGICCNNGVIRLPVYPQPQAYLTSLLNGNEHFLKNIRA